MAALTSIGIALSVAGTAVSVIGAFGQARAAKQQAEAFEKAENAREAQMKLDAQRRRREVIRQTLAARSLALSNATAQGAAQGSGLAGGMAQATATGAQEIRSVNQSEQLGGRIFSANRQGARAQAREAFWGSVGSFGGGLSSLGGMTLQNQDLFRRVTGP